MNKMAFLNMCLGYEGAREGQPKHAAIVKLYNGIKPLPRGYRLNVTDPWCAAFVSAMAWQASGGRSDAFPYECSVARMQEKAAQMKIWVEDESIYPKVGWLAVYDWQDNGTGDNKGNPDHVGVVVSTSKTQKTFTVLEGNYQDSVKRRRMDANGRYLRGFINPHYTENKPNTGNLEEIARQVIKGMWGTGARRVELLTMAGYDAKAVQRIVNKLLKG